MRYGIKIVLVSILAIIMASGFHLFYATDVAYPYRVEVSSHITNAYNVQTPEELMKEITLSMEGMRTLGLEDHMSDAYFWWDKNPSNKMVFQYKYLNQIIERAESVIEWRDTEFAESGDREQFQDLYQAKMDSLKDMIKRGHHDDLGADWIAKGAYLLAYHPIYYVGPLISIPLFLGGFALGIAGMALSFEDKKRFREFFYDQEESMFFGSLLWILVGLTMILPIVSGLVMTAFT